MPLLARVIGRVDLGEDEGLAALEGRRARHDELDAAIGSWTAGFEQYEAAWLLQRAGVSAAPVLANWQVLADPHLFRRGFYVSIEYPVVGVSEERIAGLYAAGVTSDAPSAPVLIARSGFSSSDD